MNTPLEEPAIPEKFRVLLGALWISLGLHGAMIALVQIAPPPVVVGGATIEARLISISPPRALSPLKPSIGTDETIVVDTPVRDNPVDPVEATNTPPQTEQMPPRFSTPSATPRLEIPIAVDLNYYEARELDQTPRGQIPEPVLPDTVSGRVRFQIKIEETGQVSDVEVLEVDTPDRFDRSALESAQAALRATHFTPGIKNGRPVRARMIYELTINPVSAP